MQENNNFGFNFDNTYIDLPKSLYSEIDLNKVPNPKFIIFNDKLAKDLNLSSSSLQSKEGLEILAGNTKAKNGAYIAQAYGGHQFGHFSILGDGRALLIGEHNVPNPIDITLINSHKFDIQLKGSGKTPYSRRGDGKAVLGPMLREYIISEAMYNLGIPTTRSLAVVKTGEKVYRETVKQGAILTRIATSHIRFGTFQYVASMLGKEALIQLADYTIDRHYPYIKDNENKYLSLLEEVAKVHASLVAKWMSVGFIHGVMNTDNMTISGETIDYGPCAFMDTYNPDTVFSSIDTYGRYAYKNQYNMAAWNLCRFAESLIPLIDEDSKTAIDLAQGIIHKFSSLYSQNYLREFKNKLGIFNSEENDKELIQELLDLMNKYKEDFTNTFVSLTYKVNMDKGMFISQEFSNWYEKYQQRLSRQSNSIEEVYNLMKNSNPVIIPRNHKVEEALSSAENGDLSFMSNLLSALKNPYERSENLKQYQEGQNPSCSPYRTYCGT